MKRETGSGREGSFEIIETLGRKRAAIEMREVGWSLPDIAVQCNPPFWGWDGPRDSQS